MTDIPDQPNVSTLWFKPGRLWLLVWILGFVLVFLLAAKKINVFDIGTHLRAGQWIVQNHAFPSKDTFTYTQTSRDYLDPHSLYQVLLFLVHQFSGYRGVSLMNGFVLLAVFLLLFWRFKLNKASPAAALLGFLVCLAMMERRFVVRPETFTWLFLGLTLMVLELRTRGRELLFLLPLIQFFWVNTEGLFILGWVVFLAYAISGRFHAKRWDPKLARYGLISLAADLVNPYFAKTLVFPFILATRLYGSNPYKQTIVEFYNPWKYLQAGKSQYDLNLHVLLFLLIICLGLFIFLMTRQRRLLHEWALFASFGLLGLSAVRNIPLFALVMMPILIPALQDLLIQHKIRIPCGSKTALFFAYWIVLWSLRVSTNAYYISDRRLDRLGWDLDGTVLPVKAAEFLREYRLGGRLLNTLNDGGWLNWKAPQPTFIDGRLEVMEDGFYQRYTQSYHSQIGLLQLISRYQPQLILADYNSSFSWVDQMSHISGWKLIYLDECSALYAQNDYAVRFPALNCSAQTAARNIAGVPMAEMIRRVSAFQPSRYWSWVGGVFTPQSYPADLFSLGLFAMHNQDFSSAQAFFMESLSRSSGFYPEAYLYLGLASIPLRDTVLSRLCVDKVLQYDPNNVNALKTLNTLNAL